MNYYKFDRVQIPEENWADALAAVMAIPNIGKTFPAVWALKRAGDLKPSDLGVVLSYCGLLLMPCTDRKSEPKKRVLVLTNYLGVVDSLKGAPEEIVENMVGDILVTLSRFCVSGFLMQLWQPEHFEACYLRHGFKEWVQVEMMFDEDPNLCGDLDD